jgi:hypothetical protein
MKREEERRGRHCGKQKRKGKKRLTLPTEGVNSESNSSKDVNSCQIPTQHDQNHVYSLP